MIDGDVCLLAHHADYVSAVGAGEAAIAFEDGQVRRAACIGGMLSVVDGAVTLVPTTFEWADKIDVNRAEASQHRAEDVLHNKDSTDTDLRLAEARLHRALVRKSVASHK